MFIILIQYHYLSPRALFSVGGLPGTNQLIVLFRGVFYVLIHSLWN